jgi:hypothetical protein
MSDTPEKASAKMRKDLETGRRRIVTSPSAEVNGAAGPLRRQEEPVIDTQQNPEQEKEQVNGPSGERDRVDGVITESSAADLVIGGPAYCPDCNGSIIAGGPCYECRWPERFRKSNPAYTVEPYTFPRNPTKPGWQLLYRGKYVACFSDEKKAEWSADVANECHFRALHDEPAVMALQADAFITGREQGVTATRAEASSEANHIDTQQNPEQEKERANGPSGERDRVDGVIAESSAADLIERAAGNLAEIMRGTAYSLIAAPELGDLLIAANQVRETATREPGDERTPGDEPMSDLISRSALLAEIKSWSGYQTYSAGHVLDRDLVIDEITEFPAATTQNIGGDK